MCFYDVFGRQGDVPILEMLDMHVGGCDVVVWPLLIVCSLHAHPYGRPVVMSTVCDLGKVYVVAKWASVEFDHLCSSVCDWRYGLSNPTQNRSKLVEWGGLGSRVASSRALMRLFSSVVDGVPVGSSPAWLPGVDIQVNILSGMACCLKKPSQYLNLCYLIINSVLQNSPKSNFTRGAHELNP